MKIRFESMIQSDIDNINKRAAWTDEQAKVFAKLLEGRSTDAGIMRELHIGDKRYYRIKQDIRRKISRILA